MPRTWIVLLAGLATVSVINMVGARTALAQATSSTTAQTQEEAMEPLAWLVGDWEGEGWIQRGPEERAEFTQTEHVESVFGGRLLLVEGVGRARVAEGTEGPVVHHAYGVLSWNPDEGGYRFDTYLADESGVDGEASLENGIFAWSFDTVRGKVRFKIRRTEHDEWKEVGEFSPDKGTTWYPFFEMKLRRAD